MDRLFLLSFEDNAHRTSYFDEAIRNNIKTFENFHNIATGQGCDYITGCLLDYLYFKKHYKMIAIDLSKQQALDDDLKAMLLINFTENVKQNATMLFIL